MTRGLISGLSFGDPGVSQRENQLRDSLAADSYRCLEPEAREHSCECVDAEELNPSESDSRWKRPAVDP